MNFCPGCGQPLQPNTNFCPKCGRQLGSEAQPKQKGFSFSKLKESMEDFGAKAKESKIGASVAGAASNVASKVKDKVDIIQQWDGEIVRKKPLILPPDTPDTILMKFKGGADMLDKASSSNHGKFVLDVLIGKATSPRYGKIALTRKSLQFYDVPKAKQMIPGAKLVAGSKATKLMFELNLADIDSIRKETNKLGGTLIYLSVKGMDCRLSLSEPSRFIHYVAKMAGIEGNLLNIKLRENEKVIDTCNLDAKMDR